MNTEEQRRIDNGETHMRGICGEWTSKGREICDQIVGDPFGEIVYYLLGGAWNDVLDWADRQKEEG
jgi:hypothetical protein